MDLATALPDIKEIASQLILIYFTNYDFCYGRWSCTFPPLCYCSDVHIAHL